MCGIAGTLNLGGGPEPSREELAGMVAQLRHRGPDGTGFYTDGQLGLAHARLAIIDLVSGDQPIHNEDRSVWVICNGEIFNYIELTRDLRARGHHFSTQSDTEVLVHLYEEYGEDFVDHLNGQFAIALWDARRKTLLLVRDRPGIAPLYYTEHRGRLLFASEIKALLPAIDESPQLNREALDQLFSFWVPVSPATLFRDVFELSPGEMLRVQGGRIRKRRYWEWSFPEARGDYREGSEADLAAELHELLIDATRIRLRADVPVGAYLSGGLDSSVLTSMIHHHGGVPLRSFSIGFEDRSLDESFFQQAMIDHLGASHSRIHCRPGDISEHFAQTIWHTESPVLRTAPVPMRILSGLVHDQDYRVVLTGEGADEVLGGYDLFKEAKIRHFWARDPKSRLRPLLLKRLYPYLEVSPGRAQRYLQDFFGQGIENPELPHFSHLPRFSTTARCKEFLSPDFVQSLSGDPLDSLAGLLPEGLKRWHPFHRAQYLEARTLMSGYLLSSQGDRMLLAHSVEGRFPFLDHRVIEFANGLHPRLKMKVLDEKRLLKVAARPYLPASILRRHKQPYRAPDVPSFFSPAPPEYVQEMLEPERISRYGYFDPSKVRLLTKKIQKGRAIGTKDNMAFVGILSTQLWHHHFIENHAANFGASSVPPGSGGAQQREGSSP
jgi:asparagine synthase (glutamine-hydrolysing)